VEVAPDCSIQGHPDIFVVGDLMALNGLPGLAEVALQSGRHAARTVLRRLNGREPRHFHYIDLGTMATVARFRAVAIIGRVQLTGLLGWLLWLTVHLTFLVGFKNRLAALANWVVAFFGRGRRQRTITKQQVFARTHSADAKNARTARPQAQNLSAAGLASSHPDPRPPVRTPAPTTTATHITNT
jgi:NADH dehydrogenase